MRISIISIALAVIVNLITIAVVTGFQQEVRQKISGFGAHIVVLSAGENSIYESDPIRKDQAIIDELRKDTGIESIHPVGYKPVLFQSEKKELSYQLPGGKDTTEIQQDVFGAVLKGVDKDYNWSFFEQHIISGKIPILKENSEYDRVLISQRLSKDLSYKVNDTVTAFFVKNQPVKRKFIISGIYKTGLEDFDKKIVLGSLATVQRLNDWGIQSAIEVSDTLIDNQLVVRANVSGGNGNFRYDWGKGYDVYSGFKICPFKDTVIRLIASDYWNNTSGENELNSIPDTSYISIEVEGNPYSACQFKLDEFGELEREYLNDSGTKFSIEDKTKKVTFEITDGSGSSEMYVGGFEIMIKKWDELDNVVYRAKKKVDFIPTIHDELLLTTSIKDNQQDIFVWLGFLDINVIIILALMILIGVINMGSALLVLILIRSNFIGMMKAMGANNWQIRKIFLIQAGFLIGRGILIGNIIGLAICFIQSYFGLFTLNPEVYYLSEVPIKLEFSHWLILNVGTLIICVGSLIIPSVVITRIKPVKAIKFN